jgi:ankyrin repeat protein
VPVHADPGINLPDKNGYTPLLRELSRPEPSLKVINALLAQGASTASSVFMLDSRIQTGGAHRLAWWSEEFAWLDLAKSWWFQIPPATPNEDFAVEIRMLNADPRTGQNGLTMVLERDLPIEFLAVLIGRAVQERAGGGPDSLSGCDGQGNTPLCIAAEKGNLTAIEALNSAGARIDQPNGRNQTPLMLAVRAGHVEVVRLLLKLGAKQTIGSGNQPEEDSPLTLLALRWREFPEDSRRAIFCLLVADCTAP